MSEVTLSWSNHLKRGGSTLETAEVILFKLASVLEVGLDRFLSDLR